MKCVAVKIANVNQGHDAKMANHIGNFTYVLKLVSKSFCIQKCNLRPMLFPVSYFEL